MTVVIKRSYQVSDAAEVNCSSTVSLSRFFMIIDLIKGLWEAAVKLHSSIELVDHKPQNPKDR
jgi:hypothetical protein